MHTLTHAQTYTIHTYHIYHIQTHTQHLPHILHAYILHTHPAPQYHTHHIPQKPHTYTPHATLPHPRRPHIWHPHQHPCAIHPPATYTTPHITDSTPHKISLLVPTMSSQILWLYNWLLFFFIIGFLTSRHDCDSTYLQVSEINPLRRTDIYSSGEFQVWGSLGTRSWIHLLGKRSLVRVTIAVGRQTAALWDHWGEMRAVWEGPFWWGRFSGMWLV